MKKLYTICRTRLEKTKFRDERIVFDEPRAITKTWQKYVMNETWFTELQEMFVVFHVNTKNKIIGHHLVSLGTLDATLAHPRDVFRAAIMNSAASIITVHNHPSGEVEPSEADIKISRKLMEAGKILKIDFLDSIIVDNDAENYYSLRERGYFI
jgi:DNA repair protein RadC